MLHTKTRQHADRPWIKSWICALLLLILSFSPSHAAEIDSDTTPAMRTDFHPASSDNEKTLEYLLDQADKHYNIGGRYDYTNSSMTAPVLDAIKAAQEYAVSHNCKGTESLGTNCGLKYNPVTCYADMPSIYYFRSEKSEEYMAVIYSSIDPDGAKPNKYRLNYFDHEWKIDGIQCGNGDTYNYD